MNRRSFLGLPLAAALAKQVMGAEKPRATLTAIETIGEIGVAGCMYYSVTELPAMMCSCDGSGRWEVDWFVLGDEEPAK